MDINSTRQSIINNEHLRLLSIAHYISGGLSMVFSLLFLLYFMVFFTIFDKIPEIKGGDESIAFQPMLTIFKYIWLVIFLLFFLFGIAQIISGRFIALQKYRIFSIIAAIPNLISFPYGTLLGIVTLSVISKESVSEIYKHNKDALIAIQDTSSIYHE